MSFSPAQCSPALAFDASRQSVERGLIAPRSTGERSTFGRCADRWNAA